MEINLKEGSIRAYNKSVVGCRKHNADIMISYNNSFSGEITDLFLTEKQAEELWEELGNKITENRWSKQDLLNSVKSTN